MKKKLRSQEIFLFFEKFLAENCLDSLTTRGRSAYIGVVLLGGIVANNAIIMVDHINQLCRSGMEKREAIITGATDRLRPILMTSLTTIVGLLPMVVAADKTGLWYALALATIGGMTSSTLLVLLVVPALCAMGKS